jgi:hypothetical protein
MSKEPTVQLFSEREAMATRATTTESAVARAAQEVQAAMIIAKRFPRDYTAAFNRILDACKRKSLAEVATYSYPRGGTAVTGPSIRLAECLAQNWGNVDFGIVELDQRNGESSVMAYCWDLETNTRQTKIFTVKHERRVGKGDNFRIDVLTDPRDIYEMTANQGARRLRSCILGVIPGDVVDAAVEACDATIEKGEGKPFVDKLRALPGYFDRFGVSQAMLEKKLGHKLDTTTTKEYSDLLKIWNALKDNMAKVEDFFPAEPVRPEFGSDAPEPEDDSDLGPQKQREPAQTRTEAGKGEGQPPTAGEKLVKHLKILLNATKHSEADLLNYLRGARKLEESISSLKEAADVSLSVLEWTYQNWRAVAGELDRREETK